MLTDLDIKSINKLIKKILCQCRVNNHIAEVEEMPLASQSGKDPDMVIFDGNLYFWNGDMWVNLNAAETVESISDGSKMFLSQKSNGEVVWSYNVNPESDELSDSSDSAWKFTMWGTVNDGYDAIRFQYMQSGVDDWSTSTTLFEIKSDSIALDVPLVLKNEYIPVSSTSDGIKGQIAWSAGYIYVCINTNTWVRAALTTW